MTPKPNRILIAVKDRATNASLAGVLGDVYQLATAASAEETLQQAARFEPDLVLLDLSARELDGLQTCRRLKQRPLGKPLHVVMLTKNSSPDEMQACLDAGADDYILIRPLNPNDLAARVLLLFRLQDALHETNRVQASFDSHALEIERLAMARTGEILATQDIAVLMLAKLADSRDPETGEHLLRMRAYSQILAEHLGAGGPYADQIDEQFLDDLYRSSPLHDIGKVGISDSILLKADDPLTFEEFETMKQHTVIGANVLDEAVLHSNGGGFLAMAAVIARFHHERFDGTGYPAKLAGLEIPLPARIVAVADVYDALTSARVYKAAYEPEVAKRMIEEESGRHFDPVIVDAFRARFDEILNTKVDSHIPTVVGAVHFSL